MIRLKKDNIVYKLHDWEIVYQWLDRILDKPQTFFVYCNFSIQKN